MNKIAVPAILAATVLVAGFALSSNLFIPQVYAPHVIPTTCVGGNIKHFDKIIFKIMRDPDRQLGAIVPLKTELDIKVEDDPAALTDVKQVIRTWLEDKGLSASSTNLVIEIVDVDYAIACVPS